jgi:hypothetical protein
MAFGRPCRVIAERMQAEKEDFGDYEFQKSGVVPGKGVAGQGATLPSMIAAVRGPLANMAASARFHWPHHHK